MRGGIPATRKKRCAEHHADSAGADTLKRARWASSWRFDIQNEITRPSSAVRTVPAAGPYRSTAVITNVSEIEMEAGDDGSLTEAEPLMTVSAARMNH